jgi:hypothetical protein
MNTQELVLPQHLYTEDHSPDGHAGGPALEPEKLLAWHDHGKGSTRFCNRIYRGELDTIENWKEHQLLLLEEQWAVLENGVDDDDNEAQYDLACDAVCREADDKRSAADTRKKTRESAIDNLVRQAAEHIEEHRPPPRPSYTAEYLLALAGATWLFFLFT